VVGRARNRTVPPDRPDRDLIDPTTRQLRDTDKALHVGASGARLIRAYHPKARRPPLAEVSEKPGAGHIGMLTVKEVRDG